MSETGGPPDPYAAPADPTRPDPYAPVPPTGSTGHGGPTGAEHPGRPGPVHPPEATAEPVCPRHPGTVAYVRCQRCGRPACPTCQRPAAVGIQCVDCVKESAAAMRRTTTVYGGRVTDGRPLVSYTIIAICVAVWVGELASATVYQQVAFASFLGESQPWRFLTSAFAHSPTMVLHIGFNMYCLFILGRYLEPLMGRGRFAATYLIAALGGSVMWLVLSSPPALGQNDGSSSWYTGVVGASGAVFGLFGAYLVLNRHLGRDSSAIYATLAINAVLGFVVPGIAWQAHLGGLLVGAACAAVVAYLGGPGRRALHWAGFAAITAVLVLAAVVKYATV